MLVKSMAWGCQDLTLVLGNFVTQIVPVPLAMKCFPHTLHILNVNLDAQWPCMIIFLDLIFSLIITEYSYATPIYFRSSSDYLFGSFSKISRLAS